MAAYFRRPQSGHITCYFNRTLDVPTPTGRLLYECQRRVLGFVATSTPEPGTLAFMGSGMLAGPGFLPRKLMRVRA